MKDQHPPPASISLTSRRSTAARLAVFRMGFPKEPIEKNEANGPDCGKREKSKRIT
jgi:hypothetical protein